EREPQTLDLVGVLFTDRDEALIQALLDELSAAAETAARLYHLDENGARIEYLPLNGSLPLTTTPDGVDGTLLSVTVPLVPASEEWLEAGDEPDPDEYEYQVFTTSGTWDWEAAGQPATVDVLVVAGGGGGGSRQGGGGGAGGVLIQEGVEVTGDVAVVVGVGGSGGSSGGRGSNGGASSFGAISATGGGGGGGRTSNQAGANGGSG